MKQKKRFSGAAFHRSFHKNRRSGEVYILNIWFKDSCDVMNTKRLTYVHFSIIFETVIIFDLRKKVHAKIFHDKSH